MNNKKKYGRGGGPSQEGSNSEPNQQKSQMKWVPKGQKSEEPVSQAQDYSQDQQERPQTQSQKAKVSQQSEAHQKLEDYSKKDQSLHDESGSFYPNSDSRGRGGYRGRGSNTRGSGRGGRGRQYYQDYPSDSQFHQEKTQNDTELSSKSRGSRGGRGGRGNYQNHVQQNEQQYDQNSNYYEQRGRGRGSGRGGQHSQKVRDSDYFEARKAERDQFESSSQSNFNDGNSISGDSEKIWSKKMDSNSRQKVTHHKNLGSASQYLASADVDDTRNQYLPDKDEKIKIINDKDKLEKDSQDKALIKYNYEGYLKQFENLTEQCVYFVESLSKGTQECIICQNPIFQKSALWNCKQCCQPFHLGCIKRWIKKLNNHDDEEEKKGPTQQHRNRPDEHQYYDSEEEKNYETEAQKAAKKLTAFFSWTCPNCNFAYAENSMPRYLCFCRRYDEPPFSPLILPHSCGEYCDRKRNEICTHGRCNVLCHPGSCPPCAINVPISCYCAKQQKRVACYLSQRSQYSCEDSCGRLLNCKLHNCEEKCHVGQCQKCNIDIQQKCFCGKEGRTVKCGSKRFLCQKICGKTLDCGNHECQRVCHDGACQPCQKVPSKVKFCPCNRKDITLLLQGKQRTTCLDPIPTCSQKCDKYLPCGKHQCSLQCHNDECMRCEELVEQICQCGKDKRKVPCYKVNYPEYLKLLKMTTEEIEEIENYKCKKICNQLKSCKKHKCKEQCCPVKKGVYDPFGRHLCLKTCSKTLQCGKHQCNTFCHLGLCKPCRFVSTQPLYCPCGLTKIDPPIKCETSPPTCNGPCKKLLTCGHQCNLKCHLGNCPPCLEIVTKVCNCGSEIMPNVYCNQQKHSCGKQCNKMLPCAHTCQKVCHLPGNCFSSEQDLMKNGCGERCGKPRKLCKHRCLENCHPISDCPENPCEAEIRVYCKCGYRYVNTICKSVPERDPIECNSECWKHQREKKLAIAFGSSKDYEANKDNVNLEYYPEEILEIAAKYPKFVKKCESQLTDIVLEKTTRSFSGLGSEKKSFLSCMVFEHFKLDMCTYGGKNMKTVTDVFWKDGSKVPELLVSEVLNLIQRGIMSANNDDNRNQIFEATLYIFNVQKGTSIDDLKKFLVNFKNEMYTQKGKLQGSYYIHFYRKMRAKDALTFIKNTPNQFTNVELILHKKEIGTNSDTPIQEQAAEKKKQTREQNVLDDDGFTVIKRK